MNNKLVVILGPTSVGKTEVSIRLAKTLSAEVLSADSRQFYKEMNIGTAKPSSDETRNVRHHFINNLSIQESYNAGHFEEDAINYLTKLFNTSEYAIMVGGSGLYVDAVCNGLDDLPSNQEMRDSLIERLETEGIKMIVNQLEELDPDFCETADLSNPRRVVRALEVCLVSGKPYSSFRTSPKKERDFNTIKIGLEIEREELYNRINKRVDIMIKSGLVEEAKKLHEQRGLNALETVGYTELFDHFEKKHTLEEAIELIKRNTRRYAKRQLTWFKKDIEVKWFHPKVFDKIVEHINNQPIDSSRFS